MLAYMGSVSGEAYITKSIETRFSIYRRGNIPPEIGSGSPFSVRIPPLPLASSSKRLCKVLPPQRRRLNGSRKRNGGATAYHCSHAANTATAANEDGKLSKLCPRDYLGRALLPGAACLVR